MKTNYKPTEKFMELPLETIEVLNENEFLLVRGGIAKAAANIENSGAGCGCTVKNSGAGCGC